MAIQPLDPVLVSRIKRHEGLRLQVYSDSVGVLTIGYGRNLEKGITENEAEALLRNDLAEAYRGARGFPFWHNLSHGRQRVLVEMVFQLGLGGVQSFKRMLAALEAGDYNQAAAEMLDSKWAQQTPSRAATLAEEMKR